ncbi:MAG: PAS domain-containing protein, partial [Bacteroidetes bacterium]|nr:PAS domain-containing protein [Bacteroidota bacterium]
MSRQKRKSQDSEDLGHCAEAELDNCDAEADLPQNEAEAMRLLHELQVHQIELEMQNEELRKTRAEVETALAKYTDLYDFAPAGYLTLAKDGTIRAVNFLGAKLLSKERSHLIGRPFGILVTEECRPAFNTFLDQVFAEAADTTCVVSLPGDGDSPQTVRIMATASPMGEECRMVV